jgi:hypothetical protein
MFLSKIWFILVGLVAGVATTAAFVAPRSADRKIIELEGQRLDRAQYAAEQMLKADSHRWIDYAARLSRDAVLQEALDSASKGAGEPRMLHETVRNRFKALVPNPPGVGIDSLGAVDARGRLVARVGEREAEHGDSLAGLEVIADALRGYLSDDVWGAGEKVQRVAAVPVLSKGRDRIVGALYIGAETGMRLGELWKKNLGMEVAILLRGQVRTSTVPESFLGNLPALIEERADEIQEAKRTRPISLKVGSDRLLAVAAPFAGQAGAQNGYYVLIGKMSPASDPLALLSTTTADDLKWGNFPWLGLGLGLVVILGVGILFQRMEMEQPLSRLRAEVQQLARGEIQKIHDVSYAGKFGGIARDINAALERFTLAAPPKSEMANKDLDAILGPAPSPEPSEPASVFDLPQSHFGGLAPPSPFAPPARTTPPVAVGSSAGSASPFVPPAPTPPFSSSGGGIGAHLGPTGTPFAPPPPAAASFASPSMGAGSSAAHGAKPSPLTAPPPARDEKRPLPASALGATPDRRLQSPNLSSGAGKPPFPPPRPPNDGPGPNLQRSESVPASNASAGASAPPAYSTPAPSNSAIFNTGGGDTPAEPTSTGITAAADFGGEASSPFGFGPDDANETNASEPPDEQTRMVDPEEAHIQSVFAEYVATRERCGESTASLTLEKFRSKLESNRQQLVAKYKCRTARFSVYVKDGRAAIKATPIR